MFFSVDPRSLSLSQTDLRDWPKSLHSTKTRMIEECLESVIAVNLGCLFPDEQLLLTAVEDSLCIQADLEAIDPLGNVHVFELKQSAFDPQKLKDQILSYALFESSNSQEYWRVTLSRHLCYWPELLGILLAGFKNNIRTKIIGSKALGYASKHKWLELDRYERASAITKFLCNKHGLVASDILASAKKLFKITTNVDLDAIEGLSPMQISELVIKSWGFSPSRSSLVLNLIAPSIVPSIADELERRGIFVNLTKTDLRSNGNDYFLRWDVVKRAIPANQNGLLVKTKAILERKGHPAAAFMLDRSTLQGETAVRVRWPCSDSLFLTVYDDHVKTGCDGLTEGLKHTSRPRLLALRKLGNELRIQTSDVSYSGDNLCSAWSSSNVESAALLFEKYYDLGLSLGIFEPEISSARPSFLRNYLEKKTAT